MALRNVLGTVAVPSGTRAAGAYASGPLANPGVANIVVVITQALTFVGAATLDVIVQTSPDGATWTSIPTSAITQLSATGSAIKAAVVDDDYVQVLATVGGVGSIPFEVGVLVF